MNGIRLCVNGIRVMREWNCVMHEWNSVMHEWNSVMHEWNSVMHEWNSVMREWNCVMHEWNSVMREWNSVMPMHEWAWGELMCTRVEELIMDASEGSAPSSSRTRAVNLLRIVTNLLSDEGAQDEAPQPPQNSTSSTNGAVVRNFRNLFSGYGRANRMSTPTRPPPPKRLKHGFFVPKETWTHEFFCVADSQCSIVPSRKEKSDLQAAGLGRKKIIFSSNDNAVAVQGKLEEEFPKLKAGGGFEILRSGGTRPKGLVAINPNTACGYSVKFLRDESGLGQALAYIRPLQKHLDISAVEVG